MTSRLNESSGSNINEQSDARPNQVSLGPQHEEEGCPVIEESGTVCGETRTLNIFQDFRKIYDDCMRKMEGNKGDNLALRKLAPFRKLVEDLWEQNAMLVETVEELEEEATNRVAILQNKLDECSEKVEDRFKDMSKVVNEYLEVIDSLVEVIRRFRENGLIDSSGLKFNSICDLEIHGSCKSSSGMVKAANANEKYDKVVEAANWKEKCDKIAVVEKSSMLSNMRDISTNTNDLCSKKTSPDTARSISCQSDMSPSSICSNFFSKSALRLPEPPHERQEKCYICFAAKPNYECEDSNQIYGTPDEELSFENLLKNKCGVLEKSKYEFIMPRFNLKLEEGHENIESFYSAEDCTKEIESREKLDEKVAVDTTKYEKRILKSSKDAQVIKRGRFDLSDGENIYRDDISECASPVSTISCLIDEHACCVNQLCDCDCEVCGCSRCGR